MSVLVHVMTNNRKSYFLTVAEVSVLLRLSELTIYKYIKSGMLNAVEFGGHYRISKASLDLFIENHKVRSHQLKENYEK